MVQISVSGVAVGGQDTLEIVGREAKCFAVSLAAADGQ